MELRFRIFFYLGVLVMAPGLLPGQQPTPAAPARAKDPAPESNYIEDGGISVQPFYWLTASRPHLFRGALAPTRTAGDLIFPGHANGAYGVMLSLPAGKQNSLRISYFRTQGSGNTVAATDLALFSTGYSAGDRLTTKYKLQSVKASLDFLSYTFQNNIRFKTLWEVQGALIETGVVAPATADSASSGKRWLVLPSFGMGLEHAVSKHFRWEAKGSGFGLPKRAALYDVEGSAVIRLGRAELLAGYKVFSVKTSPRAEEYFKQRLNGPYVGLRWYWERMK